MDFGKLPIVTAISTRLAWLGKRQQLVAQNIANANTPGYVTKDLKKIDFKELMSAKLTTTKVSLSATNARHIEGATNSAYNFKVLKNNGAPKSIEEQMLEVSQNTMNHQLVVNLYRKHVSMIKTALGRPS
jgi:flagellar basal-body rod protein FlgB